MGASGGKETEIKIRTAGVEQAAALLREHGLSVARPRVFEANIVYDTPQQELKARGQLL